MPDQTVTDPSDERPTNGYAVAAAELRRIADALDTLPPVDKPPYMQLSILPSNTVEAVDAIALAVLGKRGEGEPAQEGKWRHKAEGNMPFIGYISIHAIVPGPPDPREAELAQLRAEVERLRGQAGDR